MADSVKIDIDKKGFLDIKSGLDKLYPTNSKMNRALLMEFFDDGVNIIDFFKKSS